MNARVKRRFDGSFLGWWVAACVLSLTFGAPLGVVIGERVGFPLGEALNDALRVPEVARSAVSSGMAGLLDGVVPALFASLAQWLVLSQYLRRASGWLLASFMFPAVLPALSSFAAAIAPAIANIQIEPLAFLVLGSCIVRPLDGLLTGVLEWIVLRGATPRAPWWLLTSVAIQIGLAVVQAPLNMLCVANSWDLLRYACNGGTAFLWSTFFGFVSGLAFLWLFSGIEPAFPTTTERTSSA